MGRTGINAINSERKYYKSKTKLLLDLAKTAWLKKMEIGLTINTCLSIEEATFKSTLNCGLIIKL